MHAMKKISFVLAGLLSASFAHADICGDLRAINTQAASHFDGWKKDSADGAFTSNFQLDRTSNCTIGKNSDSYSCSWVYANEAEQNDAYRRLIDHIKSCPALVKDAPAIISDEPSERTQGSLRQTIEVTGFDYADAEVMVMIGKMRTTGAKADLSRNELKFSFIKAAGRQGK